jgi:site-specific DNA-cytosine methylase
MYREAIRLMHIKHGSDTTFYLGELLGNVCHWALKDLPNVDLLMGGPPCPPWSSQGIRNSLCTLLEVPWPPRAHEGPKSPVGPLGL